MTTGDRVKVLKILNADRSAGWSTVKKPPNRLLRKIGTIGRPLTGWDGYWVSFGRGTSAEKYVFAAEELQLVRRR